MRTARMGLGSSLMLGLIFALSPLTSAQASSMAATEAATTTPQVAGPAATRGPDVGPDVGLFAADAAIVAVLAAGLVLLNEARVKRQRASSAEEARRYEERERRLRALHYALENFEDAVNEYREATKRSSERDPKGPLADRVLSASRIVLMAAGDSLEHGELVRRAVLDELTASGFSVEQEEPLKLRDVMSYLRLSESSYLGPNAGDSEATRGS